MSKKKKIKDTKLGIWLKEKAPDILGIVGDLLPDSVDPEEAQRMIDAEVLFQGNVTERWKADMSSDVKLAKYIRPVTLIALMVIFLGAMVADSIDIWDFNVKESYVSLLEILMLTAFGAYFAGRSLEKIKR
jgi:hypothetical protein